MSTEYSRLRRRLAGINEAIITLSANKLTARIAIVVLRAEANRLDSELATCRQCGGAMLPGIALAQTVTGSPDFVGDDAVVTLSPGGPGRMVDCLKCENCGWSVTK